MIRIAQAASSEYGTAWGEPPNQRRTGVTAAKPGGNLDGELNIVKFATNGWTLVYRPVNPNIAERIAWIMERAVANGGHIGYGQNNGRYPRTGVFDALMMMEAPDPLQINDLVNCDCSSLVGAAVYFSGVYMPELRNMNTSTERDILKRSNQFIELSDKTLLQSAVGIQRGDILWKQGHTAVCLDTDQTRETIPAKVTNCIAANLRTGPGTQYAIVKPITAGKRCEIVSTASNGWHQVYIDGGYGYISPKYCVPLPTATATGDVWMRKGAGKDKAEIQVIPKGATVYLTGETEKVNLTTWYRAIYTGREGMVSGKLLKS